MISVLTWCFSRQKFLDITLPLWLKQEGVEFEIILGYGPGITWKHDPRIIPIQTTNVITHCANYNALMRAARGDTLMITQCDMQVNSPTQLKRMHDKCTDNCMVGERFFKDGVRDAGIYLQMLMVRKFQVEAVGGWCELYDTGKTCAFEDGDMIASMLENGMNFDWTETPEEEGVYHLSHPKPIPGIDLEYTAKVDAGRVIYNSRHKLGITALYAKQFANRMTQKRIEMMR